MRKRTFKKILLAFLAIVVILVAAAGIYLSIYNTGDAYAQSLLTAPSEGVKVVSDDDSITFMPENGSNTGVVFYPGAKVTADAYSPIANRLAEEGYTCILVHMPLNLATLDFDAAVSEMEKHEEITKWYIAGHSMGGVAAEKCAYENQDLFAGVIILASRMKYDLGSTDLGVIDIYASEDGICKREYIEEEIDNSPGSIAYHMIEGGCHGYFGFYGDQTFDGTPTISHEEQFEETMKLILEFLKK